MTEQQTHTPARNGRHGGAGSNQRRAQRRQIQRVATERQAAWTQRGVGLDEPAPIPFSSRINRLTVELHDLYAHKRHHDQEDKANAAQLAR